ncbi:MAG TPA: SRPBCC family protein [Longimicrobium sp.]|nr:SRPBCC family protein [Longimicrobium sp.]
MTAKAPVSVRVTRRYAASAERVFDAWLDPATIGRWMFGPAVRDEEVLHLRVDARVGGGFSFLVRRDGQQIDHVGTYREIDRPRRLVFSWGIEGESRDESRVVIEIAPRESGCELTLTHEMDPKWAEYAARTEAGWTRMLEALDRALG